MQIAIGLYPGLHRPRLHRPLPGLHQRPRRRRRPVAAERGRPRPTTTASSTSTSSTPSPTSPRPDVLLVPGGLVTRRLAAERPPDRRLGPRRPPATRRGRRRCAPGALLLGAAGVLDGLRATTHWIAYDAARGLRRRAHRAAGRDRRQGRHRRRRVGRHRPRPHARRARSTAPRRRRGHPARHRVRPAAALRRRRPVQGSPRGEAAGAVRADRGRSRPAGLSPAGQAVGHVRTRRPARPPAHRSGDAARSTTSTSTGRSSPPRWTGCPYAELHTSRVPSGWTPIELLKHVVYMERRWLVWGFLAEPVPDPWGDADADDRWVVAEDEPVDELVAAMLAGGERTRSIVAAVRPRRRRALRRTVRTDRRGATPDPRLDPAPRPAGVRPPRRPPRHRPRARRRRHGGVARARRWPDRGGLAIVWWSGPASIR